MLTADFLILGQVPLSDPALPKIPGIETFAGARFHSAQWNHVHDLRGERVAVIGTGASAIQFVPQIQPMVGHLNLYLRTPPWILPRHDHPVPLWKQRMYRLLPITERLARTAIYLQHEFFVLGFAIRPALLQSPMQIATHHRERQIADPALRAKLTPHYTMGCKRILISDDFYPAVAQKNVDVITEGIHEIRPHSIVTNVGQEREIDTLICATGFRATDMPIAARVHGRDGQTLAQEWRDGMQAYLGTTVAGFPNLFLLIGPNTWLGHTSMVVMMEAQFRYIMDCFHTLARRNVGIVEVQSHAQAAYNAEIQRRLRGTVWQSGCASWYLDANGRNSTIWPGGTMPTLPGTKSISVPSFICTCMRPEMTAPKCITWQLSVPTIGLASSFPHSSHGSASRIVYLPCSYATARLHMILNRIVNRIVSQHLQRRSKSAAPSHRHTRFTAIQGYAHLDLIKI